MFPPEATRDYLTTGQVARTLGVSAERVRQLMHAGRLAAVATPLGSLFSPETLAAELRRRAGLNRPVQEANHAAS